MPALPPAPGVTRAVLNYTLNGIRAANVLHFDAPPGPDAPDPQSLAAGLVTWWSGNMRTQTSAQCSLTSVVATDLSLNGPPSTEYTTGLPLAGQVVGESLPNQCAIVLSLRTNVRGRSFRGRVYIPGIGESDQANGSITTGRRDALINAWDNLITFVIGPGIPDYRLGVLSYYSGGNIRPDPIFTPVATMSMDTKIDTMRRRVR